MKILANNLSISTLLINLDISGIEFLFFEFIVLLFFVIFTLYFFVKKESKQF